MPLARRQTSAAPVHPSHPQHQHQSELQPQPSTTLTTSNLPLPSPADSRSSIATAVNSSDSGNSPSLDPMDKGRYLSASSPSTTIPEDYRSGPGSVIVTSATPPILTPSDEVLGGEAHQGLGGPTRAPISSTSSSQTVVSELHRDPFGNVQHQHGGAGKLMVGEGEKSYPAAGGMEGKKMDVAAATAAGGGLHVPSSNEVHRPGIIRNGSMGGSLGGKRATEDPEKGVVEAFGGAGAGHGYGGAGKPSHGGLGALFKEKFSNKNALRGETEGYGVPRIIGEKDEGMLPGGGYPSGHPQHNSNNHARFEKEATGEWTLKAGWAMLKQRLRNPSHPSSSSQLESALGEDSISAMGSHHVRPRGSRSATGGNSSVGRTPSNRDIPYEDDEIIGSGDRNGMTEPVSVVAVESDLRQFVPAAKSDNGSAANTGDGRASMAGRSSGTGPGGQAQSHRTETNTTQPSWVARMAHGGSFGGVGRKDRKKAQADGDDGSSIRRDRRSNVIKRTWLYETVAERAWPAVAHFCDSKFPEPSKEKSYLKEVHFTLRRGAICASLFYVISWIMTAALLVKPAGPIGNYGYMLATGIFIVPLPVIVIMDCVKTRPIFYQIWLWCATWGFSIIILVDMYDCGFYTDHRNCGSKDFLGLFYWGLALPVLAILALGAKRHFQILGIVVWAVLVIALILAQGSPALMYRNFVNFILFHSFLLMVSYLKEKSDRQLFSLRTQLKLQYRATQQAQISEKKANALSRRFVSYIFHEVRVPLNTALLAVQNLENEGVYDTVEKDQRDMVDGLQASLTMMEKVLNDVLSFNRMESGKFTQSRKPLDLHKSVQLVVLSHNAQAQASGLYLKAELDPEIDKLGGTFISDEMRIRQVMSNLVSNATKFTPSGGITVTTKLLWPRLAQFTPLEEEPGVVTSNSTDSDRTLQMDESNPFAPYQKEYVRGHNDKAIIRVEVRDTGIGLSPKDTRRGALFSPYVQTEIGRRQGGKGTGLGLALCMQIVKLMGGRMGVDSQLGVGSTFWFELALLLPPPSSRPSVILPQPEVSRGLKDHPPVHISDKAYVAPTPETSSPVKRDSLERPRPPFHQQVDSPMSPSEMAGTPDSNGSGDSNASTPFKPPYELLPYQKHMKAENVFDAIEEQVHIEVMHQQYPSLTPPILPENYEESETSTVFRKESDASYAFRKGSDAQSIAGPAGAFTPAITPKQQQWKTKDGLPPLHCLVVDDDNMTRKLMCRMLQKMGHQTDQAENGKLAFELVRQRHTRETDSPQYDMIFLDNQMPVMTGVECARELRLVGCPIFICGATGNALQDDQSEYLDAGADRILTKPIKQASMIEAMNEARLRVAGETKAKGTYTEQLSDEIFGTSIPPPVTP